MARKRYSPRPNAAIVIFAVIIFYAVCFIIFYFRSPNTQVYEVVSGSINNSFSARGVITRNETVKNAEDTGEVVHLCSSGSRVKVGDSIYAMGSLDSVTSESGATLSGDKIKQIEDVLNTYTSNYDQDGFSSVYEARDKINLIRANAVNESTGQNVSSMGLKTITTDITGYVSYSTDGLEGLTENDINKDYFTNNRYTSSVVKNNVTAGEPAYKIVTDEYWNIYIELTDNQISEFNLGSTSGVTVYLKKNAATTRANFEVVTLSGQKYGKITLNKYVKDYISDRYADIEITSSDTTGLKIPNTALTSEEFYIIPVDYITQGGDSNSNGYMVKNGNSVEFKKASAIKKDSDYYYIKQDGVTEGTVIQKPDSSETYVISDKKALVGVYCVNTGYTVFKPIEILDQNKEYTIAKSAYNQSLTIYDRIILKATGYKSNEVVY